jgi:spermidine synthase
MKNTMPNNQLIDSEMLVHVAICTHRNPQKVLVISSKESYFKTQLDKYELESVVYATNLVTEEVFDVVIYDNDVQMDEHTIAQIHRNLNPDDGVFVCHSMNSYTNRLDHLSRELEIIAKNFWISMPYAYENKLLILSSHKYHPQANIILQKSDLLEDLKYYNSDLHVSSFILPTFVNAKLNGIAKR